MLTLPNLLTLSRILAVPILVFLLWKPAPYDYLFTFVLYCVVGLTDYFDGYLARAQAKISRLGLTGTCAYAPALGSLFSGRPSV